MTSYSATAFSVAHAAPHGLTPFPVSRVWCAHWALAPQLPPLRHRKARRISLPCSLRPAPPSCLGPGSSLLPAPSVKEAAQASRHRFHSAVKVLWAAPLVWLFPLARRRAGSSEAQLALAVLLLPAVLPLPVPAVLPVLHFRCFRCVNLSACRVTESTLADPNVTVFIKIRLYKT